MSKGLEIDYSTFSKKELDQLYKIIIDTARKDSGYRRYVMQKWNIGIEEFWNRALKLQFKEIRANIEKEKYRNIIISHFQERWKTMSDEEVDREWQHLRAQVAFKNAN